MKNIAYHILDIVQNSIQAKANLITINLENIRKDHIILLTIEDNGCGMTKEEIEAASDPYFTSRSTRHVGLGLSLLKQNTERTGGRFFIQSIKEEGTKVYAIFNSNHIDCPGLGDVCGVVHSLITTVPEVDFVFHYQSYENDFVLDTREIREVLDGVSISNKEISHYLKEMIAENMI